MNIDANQITSEIIQSLHEELYSEYKELKKYGLDIEFAEYVGVQFNLLHSQIKQNIT